MPGGCLISVPPKIRSRRKARFHAIGGPRELRREGDILFRLSRKSCFQILRDRLRAAVLTPQEEEEGTALRILEIGRLRLGLRLDTLRNDLTQLLLDPFRQETTLFGFF